MNDKPLSAFTLLELLVVIAIMTVLMVMVGPAIMSLKTTNDLTSAVDRIAAAIETARSYAKSNNTYTWLGFYEEDAFATTPTNVSPPYTGKGRVMLAIVASLDGTKIYQDGDPAAQLSTAALRPVGKLIKLESVHLTDVGAPPPATANSSQTLDGRPDAPYQDPGGIGADHYNRISSDSSDKTLYNFTTQNYIFYKTIQFSPQGEANINSTYTLRRLAEIGVRQTHGNVVDANSPNAIALQFSGIGGKVQVYRK